MPRASPRKSFHSSNLIRILSDLALVKTREPGNAFAEELGLWLNLDDAITLHAVHAAGPATTLTQSGSKEDIALDEEFARLRANLMKLDLPGGATHSSSSRIDIAAAQRGASNDAPATFEPYRRCYVAHQRNMELSIRPFRVKVREVLARTSPTLAKLANLDAVFDRSLAEREKKLFAKVPSLLDGRFKQLRQSHQQSLADRQDAEDGVPSMELGAWLTRFVHQLQVVLVAELDARLEPTLGLIEAYNLEMTQHP